MEYCEHCGEPAITWLREDGYVCKECLEEIRYAHKQEEIDRKEAKKSGIPYEYFIRGIRPDDFL